MKATLEHLRLFPIILFNQPVRELVAYLPCRISFCLPGLSSLMLSSISEVASNRPCTVTLRRECKTMIPESIGFVLDHPPPHSGPKAFVRQGHIRARRRTRFLKPVSQLPRDIARPIKVQQFDKTPSRVHVLQQATLV